MASTTRRAPPARAVWLCAAASVTSTLLLVACGSDTGKCPVCPTPTPTVAAGSVTVSPAGVGIAGTTTFTFVAQGFGSSDGGPLTYAWDFHDGEVVSGGATVAHEFASAGSFDVRVTVRNSGGVTAVADARRVQVTSLSGRWGIRDASGALVLASTALCQRDQLPDAFTFTGSADDGVTRFEGRLDSGATTYFVRCSSPGACS